MVAVGLLVLGLVQPSDAMFYASIAASILAALALVVGARRLSSARGTDDDFDLGPEGSGPVAPAPGVQAPAPRRVGRASVPAQSTAGAHEEPAGPAQSAKEPPGEPAPQVLTGAQTTMLARLAGDLYVEVMVIDGRPRYHLSECLHLLGRDATRLPAGEAMELGFTPCGQCEPVTALLVGVPRA
jgi:hypothetical protein